MENFPVEAFVPRFIFRDKNGYAMVRAIQAGLDYLTQAVETGKALVYDIATMPEWRLDELAWELNCLYDYSADVEAKRAWVEDAYHAFRMHGTVEGLKNYLSRAFTDVEIFENCDAPIQGTGTAAQFGSFCISVADELTEERLSYAEACVQKAKNLRSRYAGISRHDLLEPGISVQAGQSNA